MYREVLRRAGIQRAEPFVSFRKGVQRETQSKGFPFGASFANFSSREEKLVALLEQGMEE